MKLHVLCTYTAMQEGPKDLAGPRFSVHSKSRPLFFLKCYRAPTPYEAEPALTQMSDITDH